MKIREKCKGALCACVRRVAVALALALSGLGATAHADSDHDKARAAWLAGHIQPLSEVLRVVAQEHPGRVIEVELEDDHDEWIYEIKLLSPEGYLVKLKVNAVDLTIQKKRIKR